MSSISTHVLDLSLGRPAANVPVLLLQSMRGDWVTLSSATTDNDGRISQLLPAPLQFEAGDYKLKFDTRSYFTSLGVAALYPTVEITFTVRERDANYHIPLLLTANGYSTYRGS